jgi:hypothetical protein
MAGASPTCPKSRSPKPHPVYSIISKPNINTDVPLLLNALRQPSQNSALSNVISPVALARVAELGNSKSADGPFMPALAYLLMHSV